MRHTLSQINTSLKVSQCEKGWRMYGENRELMTMTCAHCKKIVGMRVDPEDIERHAEGLFVQHAFVDREGTPYLTPAEREMWISGCCGECWDLLCPRDKLAYN